MTTTPATPGAQRASRPRADVQQWALRVVVAARAEFHTLIAHMPAEQRELRGELMRWAPKDELAHLAFWIELFGANIRARRDGGQVTDTRNYQAMNDAAWRERSAWTWAEVEHAILRALAEVETEVARLSVEELTDPTRFTVEAAGARPRPLLRSLLYELVDHPLHHFSGLYVRFGQADEVTALAARLADILQQPGVAKWAAPSRARLRTAMERVAANS